MLLSFRDIRHMRRCLAFASAAVFCAGTLSAAQEGIKCVPEPTDMVVAYGSMVLCALELPGDSDVFRFAGRSGERVDITVPRLSGAAPCVELYGTSGNKLAGSCFNLGVTLTATGTHTIRVSAAGSGPSNYALTLDRVSDPPSPNAVAIAYGQTLTGEIDPIGDTDFYVFRAEVGQSVTIQTSLLGGGGTCFALFDPSGNRIAGSCGRVTVSIVKSGLHTIKISDLGHDEPASYAVDLQCVGPCPSPGAELTSRVDVVLIGCTTCREGESFSARVAVDNRTSSVAEFKLALILPDGTIRRIGDSHLELPEASGFDEEIAHFLISSDMIAGTWRLCGRLVEVQLGAPISENCTTFTVER